MDHNGMVTFRGEYNPEDQTFEGTEELSRYWDVSVRGEIKGEYAEGSIWYTLKNDPGWNTDGFCISHFKAKKKDIWPVLAIVSRCNAQIYFNTCYVAVLRTRRTLDWSVVSWLAIAGSILTLITKDVCNEKAR